MNHQHNAAQRIAHLVSQAQPDKQRAGWDTRRGQCTAVDVVNGECTVLVRGASVSALSYIVAPSPGDTVHIQVTGSEWLVIGPVSGP